MTSLKRFSVVLNFLYQNKTKQKSGHVSFKQAKEKKFTFEKFGNDCHDS